MRTTLALFALLTLSVAASATPPCVGAVTDFVVPSFGSVDVPTNVTPFVANASTLPRIVGDDDVDVPLNVDTLTVLDGGEGPNGVVVRLLPATPLVAGRTYRVVEGSRDLTSFTVADVVDGELPAAPTATMPERYYDNCGATAVELSDSEAESTGAAFFVVAEAAPSVDDGDEWLGAGPFDDKVILHGAVHGTTLQVAGVDLAGNVSAPTPVDVRLPPASCIGCSGVDGAPLVFALVGLALRRRRLHAAPGTSPGAPRRFVGL